MMSLSDKDDDAAAQQNRTEKKQNKIIHQKGK